MPLVSELKEVARDLGIRGYTKMKKAELIEAIENNSHTEEVVKKAREQADSKPAAEKPKRERKGNAWNSYLKDKREKTGCSLKEAMNGDRSDYAEYKKKWLAENQKEEPAPAPEAETEE